MSKTWDISAYNHLRQAVQQIKHQLEHLEGYIAEFDLPWSTQDLQNLLKMYRAANAKVIPVELKDSLSSKQRDNIVAYYDFTTNTAIPTDDSQFGMVVVAIETLIHEQLTELHTYTKNGTMGIMLKLAAPKPPETYQWVTQSDSYDKSHPIAIIHGPNQIQWNSPPPSDEIEINVKAYSIAAVYQEPMVLIQRPNEPEVAND